MGIDVAMEEGWNNNKKKKIETQNSHTHSLTQQ